MRPAPIEPPIAVEPPPEALPLPASFERSLAAAPQITREAVLSTCRTWRRADGSCQAAAARRDQIHCWRQRGERELKHAQNLGLTRRRAIDHKIMLLQNLCMETRGWQRSESHARD